MFTRWTLSYLRNSRLSAVMAQRPCLCSNDSNNSPLVATAGARSGWIDQMLPNQLGSLFSCQKGQKLIHRKCFTPSACLIETAALLARALFRLVEHQFSLLRTRLNPQCGRLSPRPMTLQGRVRLASCFQPVPQPFSRQRVYWVPGLVVYYAHVSVARPSA